MATARFEIAGSPSSEPFSIRFFSMPHASREQRCVRVRVSSMSCEMNGNPSAFLEQWLRARPQLAPRVAHARRVTAAIATGPFASHARRAWAPGVALVGDAADFFDPFTGEGIYSALRGGEMLAPYIAEALFYHSEADHARVLAGYDRARKREFGGKWKLERIVGLAIAHPYFL